MPMDDFGALVWEALVKRDMSQYQLSRKTNLYHEKINRIVNGRRRPTEVQVFRIWAALYTSGAQRRILNRHLGAAEQDIIDDLDDNGLEFEGDGFA